MSLKRMREKNSRDFTTLTTTRKIRKRDEKLGIDSNLPNTSLNYDIIISILERLPLTDLARAKSLSKYCYSHIDLVKPPRLILAPESNPSCRFINLEDNAVIHSLNKTTSDMFLEFQCVGSSHEWLIFCDKKTLAAPLILFNSLTLDRVQLPPPLPVFQYYPYNLTVQKATLTGNPNSDCYSVQLLCNIGNIFPAHDIKGGYSTPHWRGQGNCGGDTSWQGGKLVYYKNGDTSWKTSDSVKGKFYDDAIWFNNELYVSDYGTSLWTWDGSGPKKLMDIPDDGWGDSDCQTTSYLVEVNGELMIVYRYNNLCRRPWEENVFSVYKVDLEEKRMVHVKSLGDWCLFIGLRREAKSKRTEKDRANKTGLKRNSIYFMNDCLMSKGHFDVQVYDLEEGKVRTLFEFPFIGKKSSCLYQNPSFPTPEPCWIVPS